MFVEDVDKVVCVVCGVFCLLEWLGMGVMDCGRFFLKFVDLIEENKEIFVVVDVWDNGKFLNINIDNGIVDYV